MMERVGQPLAGLHVPSSHVAVSGFRMDIAAISLHVRLDMDTKWTWTHQLTEKKPIENDMEIIEMDMEMDIEHGHINLLSH